MLAPGHVVAGRYRIASPLGSGGMGTVYRAEHLRLAKPVALKVLTAQAFDPDSVRRFVQEGVTAARVRHRAIVEVYDSGVDEGVAWLAMELCEGATLAERLATRGRLSADEIVPIVQELLLGLAAAHDAGIVHRDVKPANVFLARERHGTEQPKLLDFGVARVEADPLSRSTRPGAVIGTATHLSPEQARGLADVDARSDLWAVGVVLFEALSGALPFDAPTLPGVLIQIVSEPPRDLRELAPDAPAWLAQVVRRCLEQDRDLRPQTARELHAMLDGAAPAALAPTMAPPPAALARLSRVSVASRGSNVRAPGRSLVGRATALAAVEHAFEAGARVVTLVGAGGTGKTRLALEVAVRANAAGALPGGVWFCDLADVRDAGAVEDRVASVLGIPIGTRGVRDPGQIAHAIAARGPTLLVLDNVEQVVRDSAPLLAAWRDRARAATFLVTSREALGVEREHVIEVGPLELDAAARLFVERASALRSDTTTLDPDVVRQIVLRLEGIPLAVELAAARLGVMSLAQIAERLSQRFRLLASTSREAPARQATLRAAIGWSWDLLEPHERSALAQCSVFRGGFTLDAAEAVIDLAHVPGAPWTADVLDSLRRRSLVRFAPSEAQDTARFSFFETIREYAAEQLDAEGGRAAAEGRHASWYVQEGERLVPALATPAVGAARRTLIAESENLFAVVDGASLAGSTLALRALLVLAPVAARACPGAFRSRLDAVLLRVDAGSDAHKALLARVLAYRAASALRLGEIARATEDVERAEALAIAAGDAQALREARIAGARVARSAGRLADAAELLESEIARAPSAELLADLSTVRWHEGRIGEASEAADRALVLALGAGDPTATLEARVSVGIVAAQEERFEQACAQYEAALASAREAGDTGVTAVICNNLGVVRHQLGELDDAARRYEEALALARANGRRQFEGVTLGNVGILAFERGELATSRESVDLATWILDEVGDIRFGAWFTAWGGAVRAAEDRAESGRARIEEAFRMIEPLGDGLMTAAIALHLGLVELAEARAARAHGDTGRAKALLATARERAASARDASGGRPAASESDNVRFALRALEAAIARHGSG